MITSSAQIIVERAGGGGGSAPNIHASHLVGAISDGVLGDVPNSAIDFTTGAVTLVGNSLPDGSPIFGLTVGGQNQTSADGGFACGILVQGLNNTVTHASQIIGIELAAFGNDGGGTAENVRGLWVSGISGGTNQYAIQTEDVTGGTTNFAIKTGLGQISFGDRVDITAAFTSLTGTALTVSTQTIGTGTGQAITGASINAQNETADAMTTVLGLELRANADDGGGTATDVIALHIEDVSGGTIQNFAIQTGLGDIVFGNTGGKFGIFGATPAAKQTVTGAKLPSDTVMASLLAALVSYGLITDSTT